MYAEREEHESYYHPDGDVFEGEIPAQLTLRIERSLGSNPEKTFSSVRKLKQHIDLYSIVKRFQEEGRDVYLTANAHKGVIITAVVGGIGMLAAGILVKKELRSRRKK